MRFLKLSPYESRQLSISLSNGKYEKWMRLCLDMLVLEGILERTVVNSVATDSWYFTEYGEEFIAVDQIKAEINMFAEVAIMGNLYSETYN